ncbi:MAG: hypothetical protein DRJ30_07005 [Candidatus Methanomethylicota archaeon]|nr:MAG: hypothetical protein DRJ30_07005 [Candidatus Verstraetearchaeota archaeon]
MLVCRRYHGFIPRDLKQLIFYAKKVLSNENTKRFLWEHTRSVHQYHTVVDCIKILAELDKNLVTWKEAAQNAK